jgi:hypothetical protein
MHDLLVVLLEEMPKSTNEVEALVTTRMAPYDYNNCDSENPTWDSWCVGGIYTGIFDEGYEPGEDPDNYENCNLCNGTGERTDVVEFLKGGPHPSFCRTKEQIEEERELFGNMFVDEDEEWPPRAENYTEYDAREWLAKIGCNGCNGTGRSIKWSEDYAPFHGDYAKPVGLFLDSEIVPTSILTPDGKWHEGNWYELFARFEDIFKNLQSDEYDRLRARDEQKWVKKCEKILTKYKNCFAVIVDYHH